MLIEQDKELKNAILNLPAKEKDKMLLKLISKDVVLMEQLRHKLLAGNEGLEERRELAIKEINQNYVRLKRILGEWIDFLSPGQFMMELRYMNGIVNDHILITKDKLGDVELRMYIIEKAFELQPKTFKYLSSGNQKLVAYINGRIKYILGKYGKLHEDYQFDLKERINHLLRRIHQLPMKVVAEELMLPESI